jgi:gluconokinase
MHLRPCSKPKHIDLHQTDVADDQVNEMIFVVMGVCGCGKSTLGAQLAAALQVEFLEGDTLHSASNVAKMAAGTALNDADRALWLQALADHISQARQAGQGLVLSCSALKRSYRDVLRRAATDLHFVYLRGDHALLSARLAARKGHYMPASLLKSQLGILQEPTPDENPLVFDITSPTESMVAALLSLSSSLQ